MLPYFHRCALVILSSILNTSTAHAEGALCTPKEVALWSCSTESKSFSLCASKDLGNNTGYIQYRASESGRLTFTYPANKQHPKGVFKVYQSNRFANFEFSNGKFSYRITDQLVGPTTIYIEKEKKALSEFECITPAVPSILDNESLRLFSLAGIIQ